MWTSRSDRHQPILAPLEHLITRGQRTGEFDHTLPVSWLLAAIIGLGHAGGEEVRAGRLTPIRPSTPSAAASLVC